MNTFFRVMATVLLGGGMLVADDNTPAGLDRKSALSINDFETEADLGSISIVPGFWERRLNTDPRYIRNGKGSLRLIGGNRGNAKANGNPGFFLALSQAVDLSGYRGLGFWLYVPQGVSENFFGRYDVKVKWNCHGTDIKKVGNFLPASFSYNWGDTPLRALSQGWRYYYWDFRDFTALPQGRDLGFSFGELMGEQSEVELFIDDLVLYPAAELSSGDDLFATARKDSDWTRRYRAVLALDKVDTPEALATLIAAGGDDSRLIRETSRQMLTPKARRLGTRAEGILQKLFQSDDHRVRSSVLRIAIDAQELFSGVADRMIDQALTDGSYFLRSFAYEELRKKGETPENVAGLLLRKLNDASDVDAKIACIRTLDMIGPEAKKVSLAPLLALLRDPAAPPRLRAWALKAAWWIDETSLTVRDWSVGFGLRPGEIHRHLLDLVCRRLESAGQAAVPVLTEKLVDPDPQLRARAAALLGHIGTEAQAAVPALTERTRDVKWYVAREAAVALDAIRGTKLASFEAYPALISATGVRVRESGDRTIVSNGLIELVFRKGAQCFGPIEVREEGGPNLIESEWLDPNLAFRYTKSPAYREKQWIQRFGGAPFPTREASQIVRADRETVEFVHRYSDGGSPFVYEFHYVVQKGLRGFYGYIVVKNVSGKEVMERSGRLNYLLAVTPGHYEYAFLHDKFKGEAAPGAAPHAPEEIMNATVRRADGQIWAKHEWDLYELESPVTGFCGKNGGLWLIAADKDFWFDRYPRWDKTGVYNNIFVQHFEAKYEIGNTCRIDERFEKIYGPMLFYVNHGENAEEMWTDAKRQAAKETSRWPYRWLANEHYHDRGSVKGKVVFADGTDPKGTYVILGRLPETPLPDSETQARWMFSESPYNYYVRAAADGSFEIPNVHRAVYDISIYKPGVLGADRTFPAVRVTAKQLCDVGTLTVPADRQGRTIWQIGVPDGGGEEFRNGGNFHNWDNYDRYAMDFPNGVHYIVGKSDWKKDWNYVQPACVRDVWLPTTNTIHFELSAIPQGDVVLSVGLGGRDPKFDVILNGKKLATWFVRLGRHTLRSAPYSALTRREVTIPKTLLKKGNNVLQFTFARGFSENSDAAKRKITNWTSQILYDYIRLEERTQPEL